MIIVNNSVVKYKYNESIAIIRNTVNKKKKVNIINIYSHNILFSLNLLGYRLLFSDNQTHNIGSCCQ
jgi:hypothetical protein